MSKKIRSTLLLFLCIISLKAQKVTLTWGSEGEPENFSFVTFAKGEDGDLIKFCFKDTRSGSEPVFTRYDEELEKQHSLAFLNNAKGASFVRFLGLKEKLLFFTQTHDGKADQTTYYCQYVDPKIFTALGPRLNLGTFSDLTKNLPKVRYSFSKDSTKILMHTETVNDKTDAAHHYFGIFDQDMKKLWEKNIITSFKKEKVLQATEFVTNDGLLVLNLWNVTEMKKDVAEEYTSKLMVYSKDSAAPQEYKLSEGTKLITDLKFCDDGKEGLTFFSLYRSKFDGFANGYLVSKINLGTQKITHIASGFPLTLLQQLRDNDNDLANVKDKDAGISNSFNVVQYAKRENGDEDFILEYARTVPYINIGDIIDISLKKNGTQIVSRIPKMQKSVYGFGISFKAVPYKDKLLFFYNDRAKNLTEPLTEKANETKLYAILGNVPDVDLVMASVDAKGNVERKVIASKPELQGIPVINMSLFVAPKKLAFYTTSMSKDKYCYLLVE